jgi:hypothetical protein
VTGSADPLGVLVLRSLGEALLRANPAYVESAVWAEIEAALEATRVTIHIDDRNVLCVIQAVCSFIRAEKVADGLLLIIDELGKFLEYAVLHPDREDVYVLQMLAELAARSGDAPIILVGVLHQGFQAYTEALSKSIQNEWEKVAGRFEEIIFALPLEQTAGLIANALGVEVGRLPSHILNDAVRDMQATLALGWYGAAAGSTTLLDSAAALYPLHPTVLPALVRLFRTFGQNERSLFSFLQSSEPFALQEFAAQPLAEAGFYRLSNLYDYARAAFGHRLALQSYRSHWNYIDGVIQSFPSDNDLDLRVLKTVGILNLLDLSSMLPTTEAISVAVAGGDSAPEREGVQAALDKLQRGKKALYYRGASGGYCLWPYTSVNLDRAYKDAQDHVGNISTVLPYLEEFISARPMVARRHYISTGNLRHFSVTYGSLNDVKDAIRKFQDSSGYSIGQADGFIYVPLCETEQDRSQAVQFAQSSAATHRSDVLIAVPLPLRGLIGLVQEVRYWRWIKSNTPELVHDTYAAEEVDRQLHGAEQALRSRVRSLVGFDRAIGETVTLDWYRNGHAILLPNARRVLEFLSDICDDVYPQAPKIHNELINRRLLSSAAAAARMRLIERMFSHTSAPLLGMNADKKPPEMSMYMSVVRAAQLHQATGEHGDRWRFTLPGNTAMDDPCHVRPALDYINAHLEQRADERVRISDIYEGLRSKPYGVRDGLLPVLLATFVLLHRHDVAMYEDGAFLPQVSGEAFMRLIKAPTTFELQICRITGIRNVLFERLAHLLHVDLRDGVPQLLDIAVPLCEIAGQLPSFTLQTKQLSEHGLKCRDVLARAEDPTALVFSDLPQACGFAPFLLDSPPPEGSTHQYVETLSGVLDELRLAYPALLDRMRDEVRRAFSLTARTLAEIRYEIAARAQHVLLNVQEPRLKALCLRLADRVIADVEWLESLGSLICLKPPARWHDYDSERFGHELTVLAQRFIRVEAMVFPGEAQGSVSTAMRLSVTQWDGREAETVLYLTATEEQAVREIANQLESLIAHDDRLALIAAARVVWARIHEQEQ